MPIAITGELREATLTAERELIGAIIWSSREDGKGAMDYLRGKIAPDDFLDHQYRDPMNQHSRIFRAMLECSTAHEGYVAQKMDDLGILRKGDIAYLFYCTSLNCHMVYDEYAEIVLKYSRQRRGHTGRGNINIPITRE